MTDLASLTARVENVGVRRHRIYGRDSQPVDLVALIRDLLTYATTVSQDRDAVERAITAAEFRIATLCEAHEEQFIRADHAEQERDAAIARAEQAEDLLREWLEADFYSVRAKDLRTRTKAAFPDETMEQQEARAARRKP